MLRQRGLRLARSASAALLQASAPASGPQPAILVTALEPWLSTAGWRCLRTSSALWESITVVAPSMGESISEGSIAALLKKAGDTVEEVRLQMIVSISIPSEQTVPGIEHAANLQDEAIAQIETDKVTIDVRSPKAGRIEEYKVNRLKLHTLAWPACTRQLTRISRTGEGRRHDRCRSGSGHHCCR